MVKKMNVPKLRFPEFNDEYNLIVLNDILFSHNAGIYIEKSQYGFGTNIVGVSNLYDNTKIDGQFFRFAPLTEDDKINYLLDENDIIYGESSLVPIGIARTLAVSSKGKNTAFEWHTRRFKINNDVVNSFYLSYMFNFNNKIRKRLASVSTQTALTGITTKDFFSTKFYIPKLEEQNKVVKLIDLLDKKIELQTKKIEALKLFKLGIKNRMFENGGNKLKLKDILSKWKEKNKNGTIKYVESINNKHGFISQLDQFEDRSVASKDLKNYYIIRKNVFGYNPSRLNVGSLALKENDTVSVVSPLYECFTTNQNNKFLLEWFDSKYFRRGASSKFEGGVRNTLNFSNLCEIEINLPSLEKQDKYASILSTFDKKIYLEDEKLNKLNNLKKGLLQKMFV